MKNNEQKTYIYDLEEIINFVFGEEDKRSVDSEITETYVVDDDTNDLQLVNKQLREVKSGDASNKQTIKYDIIKNFIDVINGVEMTNSKPVTTLGENIIINTMVTNGLIKEIKEE